MKLKHVYLGLIVIGAMLVLAACAGATGPQGPAGPAGPQGPAGPAGPAGAAAPTAVPAASVLTPELCGTCHANSGAAHQVAYNEIYQDGVIKISDVTYTFAAPATHTVTFKATKNGAPFNAAGATNLAIYYVPWTGKAFQFEPVADRFSLKGKVTCAAGACTSVLAGTTDAQKVNYSAKPGIVVVYGRDEDLGQLPERVYQTRYPFAGMVKIGVVDYVSLANDAGCVKCHTDPYLKHGYIYGQVNKDVTTDFYTCKVCHLDNGKGGHYEWQLLVDNPPLATEYLKDATKLTEAKAKEYAYKTSLMNDVHMSHAMEFPYPASMANCATCHEGKLDKVLADENLTIETCKSCHPMTGMAKKNGDVVVYDTTKLALKTIVTPAIHGKMDLNTTDCTSCHKKGGSAPQFSAIHTGYDAQVYAAAKQKYADVVTVTIDSAAIAANKLTIKFSAAEKPDLANVKVEDIVPTVLVGLYGWDTKDFIIGPHERLTDDNADKVIDSKDGRALETVWGDKNPRFTNLVAAGGKWEVTADLSTWDALIKDGTVKRLEIGIIPTLKDKAGVVLALNAVSKTFDLKTNKFDTAFFKPITDPKKCNSCHDALGTTFHTADRGGSVVVCRMCHITKSGGSHLELQSRSIDSYVHAIHAGQPFDVGTLDMTDPVVVEEYTVFTELPFPRHGNDCESCHFPGTYNVPNQAKSLPGIQSSSSENKTWNRAVTGYPSVIVGPATRACGGCHKADLVNEDSAGEWAIYLAHMKQGGYIVDVGKDPAATLDGVIKTMMKLFK